MRKKLNTNAFFLYPTVCRAGRKRVAGSHLSRIHPQLRARDVLRYRVMKLRRDAPPVGGYRLGADARVVTTKRDDSDKGAKRDKNREKRDH